VARRDVHTVVLHVGLPKSGTTYLQRSLEANAVALGDRGVLHPRGRVGGDDLVFRAALDLRGNHKAWGRRRADVEGAWDQVCGLARTHTGTTVVSHELLAAASRRQVVAATTMLKDLDLHVVVTARDLARQLVAEWQEGLKHGRTVSFAEYQQRVARGEDALARHFHAAQDLPDVLARWGHGLPADRVHVVVAEPEGADPSRLWARFAEAVGFDPDGYPPAGADAANPSLGVAEVDLLRRVNTALDGRLRQPAYGRLVKHRLAHGVLSPGASPRPRLPLPLHDDLVPVTERWVKEIQQAGYVVHGDLAHLVPVPPRETVAHPDVVTARTRETEVAVAAAAIAALLLDLEAAEARAADRDEKRRSWKKRTKKLRVRLAELTD
jgi:hypothetical protein